LLFYFILFYFILFYFILIFFTDKNIALFQWAAHSQGNEMQILEAAEFM